MKRIRKLSCCLLVLAMLALFGCRPGGLNKPQGSTTGTSSGGTGSGGTTGTGTEPTAPGLTAEDLAAYQVVYPKGASDKVTGAAAFLAEKLNIPAVSDEKASVEKEILIGNTNRQDSTAVAAAANLQSEATAYAIEVRAPRIVIAGKNETSLIYGVKVFFGTFVDSPAEIPADYQFLYVTDHEVTVYDDYTVLEMGTPALVYGMTSPDDAVSDTSYPKVIRLEHSRAGSGVLLATMEIKNEAGETPFYRIFRSRDDGKTWETLAEIKDTKHNLPAHWNPYLYELPMQVGSMPEGTLILAGCMSRHKASNDLITSICLWRSFNGGLKWEHFSDVDQSYVSKEQNGVWEPILSCTEEGKLLCFYSDENDKEHYNQRLVWRESSDGVRWGEVQNAIALSDGGLRPGMLSFVRLNNGKYFATNELVGEGGGPIYYRTTDSLTDWGNVTVRGTKLMLEEDRRMLGTSPWVGYIPGNGGCGLLLISAEHMIVSGDDKGDDIEVDLFASLDYGATWFAIKNPMPYQNVSQQTAKQGYSSGFFTAGDGHTAYFIQATDWDYPEKGNHSVTKIVTMKVW